MNYDNIWKAQMGIEPFLGRLNSATKYPSILTYHEMGNKGRLTDKVQIPFDDGEELFVTEKIDGTNTRIIVFPHEKDGTLPHGADYMIGSREDILHAYSDRVINEAMGIVRTSLPVARLLLDYYRHDARTKDCVQVYYGEAYGHGIGKNGNRYTSKGETGFRVFDIAEFVLEELEALLGKEREEISQWRQRGGQEFVGVDRIRDHAFHVNQNAVNNLEEDPQLVVVPRLHPLVPIPKTLEAAKEWVSFFGVYSTAVLDDNAQGMFEGVVVRTKDRKKIAKLRVEDYARTLGK